jgi:hypothetical protein
VYHVKYVLSKRNPQPQGKKLEQKKREEEQKKKEEKLPASKGCVAG